VALIEFPPISGSLNSGNSLPLQCGMEVVRVLSLSILLALSRLGSAPNSVPDASLAQLPYAARTAFQLCGWDCRSSPHYLLV